MENQLNSDREFENFKKALKKYKHIIFITTLLSIIGGLIYLKFQVPIYKAYSIVKVKSEGKTKRVNSIIDLYNYGNSNVKEDITLLQTFYMNKKAIEKNIEDFAVFYFKNRELYQESPIEISDIEILDEDILKKKVVITPIDGDSFSLRVKKSILDKIAQLFGKKVISIENREFKYNEIINTKYFRFKVKKLSNFDSSIKVKLNGDSRNIYEKIIKKSLKVSQLEDEVAIIKIAYNDNIRKRAIKYIDTLTDTFIKESILSKSEQSNKILEFINRELNKMRERVEKSEKALERYRVSNDVISPSTQASTLIKDLSSIDIQISQNSLKKEIIDNLVDVINRDYRVEALAPSLMQLNDQPTLRLIELLKESELKQTQLLSELTYKHPDVIAVQDTIDSLREQIRENVKNLKRHIDTVQRDLLKMKYSYEKRLRKLPTKERRLINLKRDYEVSSKMYNFLLEKQAENEIIRASTISDYKVIDRAYGSNTPVSPKKLLVLGATIVLGVILGVILAVIKSKMEDSIEDSEFIKSNNIKIYGEVVEGFLEDGDIKTLQSYRDIRANIQLILKDIAGAKKIFITSVSFNSSKDIFSANLGIIFQLAGFKSVILDLNFKKPIIHKLFRVINVDCGISDYLKNSCSINEAIYSTKYRNLHIIPAGKSFKSYELILSNKLKELISKLEKEYDYIILNGASLKDIPDIKQLFLNSSLNIVHIKQNATKRGDLEYILNLIKEHNISNIGVVFEKIKTT